MQLWRKRRTEGYFRKTSKTNNGEIKWGMDRFIEIKALREIAILEQDIRARLKYSDVYFINEQFHKRDKIEKALFLKVNFQIIYFFSFKFFLYQSILLKQMSYTRISVCKLFLDNFTDRKLYKKMQNYFYLQKINV